MIRIKNFRRHDMVGGGAECHPEEPRDARVPGEEMIIVTHVNQRAAGAHEGNQRRLFDGG
jgi:hypothetical protein